MKCWKYSSRHRWHNMGARKGSHRHGATSGNSAFDEYREETLRRLEDEQGEFESFLERLRHAKDKAEFDQFMKDRRDQPDDLGATDGEAPQPSA